MKRSAALWGILGLELLAFGLVDYFMATGFRVFVFANLIAGVFAIVLWLTSSRDALASIAGSRATRYGTNAALYSAGFVGLLVAVNYISNDHHRRFDLTEQKIYSLSSQSTSIVKSLPKPLKLYGFFEGGQSPAAENLYEMYAYASPKVTFQLVDPDKHPELAERYKVSTMGTTHLQYGADDSSGEGTNVSEATEEAITNAIIKVTKAGKRKICFLDGHGEANPDNNDDANGFGALRKALEGEGFEINKLLLASQPAVPPDCNIVIVAGPRKPVLPHEIEQLNDYLKKGGRVLVMLQPPSPDQPNDQSALIKLVSDWGVTPGNDIVVDQVVRLFAGPALGLNPMVSTYGTHPITKSFTERTVFPMTRSVEPDEKSKPGLVVTALAKTGDTSWAETNLDDLFKHQTATLDAKDRRGPITVVAAVDADLKTLNLGSGNARLIVFGDTAFADNQYLGDFFNRDFFINGVDWLAGEEKSISIRPRSIRSSRFRLTVDQFSVVFFLSVLLLPQVLLLTGTVVWWERRN